MSESFQNFKRAITDAQELLNCYDTINTSETNLPVPEVLKRACLIMTLTAWETYVEDIATELFQNKYSVLKGSQIGNFLELQFNNRLKIFHNPDSAKTKQLFEDFFGIDVTEQWNFPNYIPKQARETLNLWLKKRGDAVHRAKTDLIQPHIVKRDELDKCIRFISELASVTDKALMAL